ncbi:membrane protein, major facilitator superfamily [Syntrophotalea carbinolica DSM 2380]|uniref:Membrane protein, major facilitator superfamily n=1 Tax=Syntrophotalea carbinolica (strain DSM 2380 / NBRC 103641 / GraBd1) TaxID=338963 RepID=Q3A3G2_SYNC1|nr:MFS transporter [Syntrophotalea carbinolica]ABA89095.1 membrane protein, major facilitator superfamily [Syntrophotalea carbinolica DSM 2380]
MPDPVKTKPAPTRRQAWFGWCMYDWANSAFATVILAAVLPVYFVSLVPTAGVTLPIIGGPLSASALWSYAVAGSMTLVALAAPGLGAIADRSRCRRRWLMILCVTGASVTCLLALAGPGRYLLAAGLFMLANACFATANIFYNAFLPALAQNHEMDRLSARGFALGYVGGGLMLLLTFLLIQHHDVMGLATPSQATRLGFFLTGLWWLFFSLPTFYFLREEMIPLPSVKSTTATGLRAMWQVWKELRDYPDLLRFLLAYLFYNDGIQTVIAVAAIFGKDELGLGTTSILGCFLMIQFVAMPGSLLFARFAHLWGAKRAILLSLVLFTVVTVYAYAMQQAWQFWLMGLVVALILGGSQAISRSLFGSLLPPGKNAEFYSFYAVSGKFAAILGPVAFGLLAQITGSNRMAILGLGLFFGAGFGLLLSVNVQRGREAALEKTP